MSGLSNSMKSLTASTPETGFVGSDSRSIIDDEPRNWSTGFDRSPSRSTYVAPRSRHGGTSANRPSANSRRASSPAAKTARPASPAASARSMASDAAVTASWMSPQIAPWMSACSNGSAIGTIARAVAASGGRKPDSMGRMIPSVTAASFNCAAFRRVAGNAEGGVVLPVGRGQFPAPQANPGLVDRPVVHRSNQIGEPPGSLDIHQAQGLGHRHDRVHCGLRSSAALEGATGLFRGGQGRRPSPAGQSGDPGDVEQRVRDPIIAVREQRQRSPIGRHRLVERGRTLERPGLVERVAGAALCARHGRAREVLMCDRRDLGRRGHHRQPLLQCLGQATMQSWAATRAVTVGQHLAIHGVTEAVFVERRCRHDHLDVEGLVDRIECRVLVESGDLGGHVERERGLEQRTQRHQ